MMNREDWHMIQEIKEKGCYNRDIAVAAGCCEKTVSRALQRGGPPAKRKPGIRPSELDGYNEEIDRLLQEAVWDAEEIFIHLKQLGYPCSAQ
jgi:IS30 family transposase